MTLLNVLYDLITANKVFIISTGFDGLSVEEKLLLLSHHVNKVPDITTTLLRHYLWNLPPAEQ